MKAYSVRDAFKHYWQTPAPNPAFATGYGRTIRPHVQDPTLPRFDFYPHHDTAHDTANHFFYSYYTTQPAANYTRTTTWQSMGGAGATGVDASHQERCFWFTPINPSFLFYFHSAARSAAHYDNAPTDQSQRENSVLVKQHVDSAVNARKNVIKLIADTSENNITTAELTASYRNFLLTTVQQKLKSGELDLNHSSKALADLINVETNRFLGKYQWASGSKNHSRASNRASARQPAGAGSTHTCYYEDRIMTEVKKIPGRDLASGASKKEIRKAWLRLLKEFHPDKGGNRKAYDDLESARDSLMKKCVS